MVGRAGMSFQQLLIQIPDWLLEFKLQLRDEADFSSSELTISEAGPSSYLLGLSMTIFRCRQSQRCLIRMSGCDKQHSNVVAHVASPLRSPGEVPEIYQQE